MAFLSIAGRLGRRLANDDVPMKQYLRFNFNVSVLVCIAAGLALFIMPSLLVPAATDADADTRSMVANIGLSVAVVQFALWVLSYRHHEGQLAAFAIGAVAVLLGQYIGEHLGADMILTATNLESLSNVSYYVGLSHLLYFVISSQAVLDWLAAFKRVRRRW
jgi:hypothetical protein